MDDMTNSTMSGRVHALDNLRACMMWLGIVLHVAVNHITGPSPMPFKDRDLTLAADLTLMFINTFRMPVFFMLAGFLVAMMADTRGYPAMVNNRVRRLALPFAVFWPVVYVATVVLVIMFRHLMAKGTVGFDPALLPKPTPGHAVLNTMHMWFIYYLFLLCMIAGLVCAVEQVIPVWLRRGTQRVLAVLARNWWGFLVLAVPIAIAGSGYRAGILAQTGSFVPNIPELVHNGMFFLFGWTVYRARDQVLPHYAQHCWKYFAGGLVAYFGSGALFQVFLNKPASIPHIELVIAYVYGSAGWLWSMALIGGFVRYLPTQNRVLRYLSDSSYWVFMVHMLCTIGFGILLYNAPLGALAKIGINILATTLVCLATYQLFVRNTWIGMLLNGQRRGCSASLAAAPA
jgi:glucan biosynthesis protein C